MCSGWTRAPLRRVVVTIAAIAPFFPAAAEDVPAVIGIDNRHGFSPDFYLASAARYEMFRAEFDGGNNTLVPLTTFDPNDLAGLDALILSMPDTTNPASFEYTPAEIDAIHDFVAAGGGLMFHGDCGGISDLSVANVNALLSPYGITFAATGQSSVGEAVPPSAYAVSHPVLGGITRIIGLDYYRAITSVSPPAIDLFTPAASGSRFIAVANTTFGSGNVVALGDTSMWNDPGEGDDTDILFYDSFGPPVANDNLLLLHNIIRYVTALVGDVNIDGEVDLTDLGIVLGHYGETGTTLTDGDVNGDGEIDLTDIGMLLGNYGKSR